jgi:hypothetical protein
VSYDKTRVPIAQSQSDIRRMIYAHKGTGVSFVSQPPREGFEALVTLAEIGYHIRVMATCKKVSDREQEERRVWRVLHWHLKAMFEAADSGVIAVDVTPDGRTIAEHIAPKLAVVREMTGHKLLSVGGLT